MYKISVPAKENTAPWEVPFSSRYRTLRKSLKDGVQVALLLYERADTSTFRYRGYNMAQITKESSRWRSVYFFTNEIEKLFPYLSQFSLAVVIRVKWTHTLEKFIYEVKSNHIPLLFDVDDLVFDTKFLPMVTNTLNVPFKDEMDYDFWFAYIGRIEYTAAKADGFITTNSFLGEKLQSKFHKPYGIIPNFLNEEQLRVSERCLAQKKMQTFRSPFTIGYFSGTPSHINDFKTIYKELILLLEEFKDIKLKVVGFMEFPPEMQSLILTGRVTFTPLVDFLELQRLTAEVDVNIVPLVNNIFTNCKSELKFFEAAVVNTPTFAQPTYTYQNCITDGVNGFLCRQGEWYEKIKAFYLGQTDAKSIIKNAHYYAMEHYQGQSVLEQAVQCYDNFYNKI